MGSSCTSAGVSNVHRLRHTDRIFFVCVNLRPKIPWFNESEYELLIKVLEASRQRLGFALCGYVLMPDQVHLLMSEPQKADISRVLQVLKQRVSRAMRSGKRRSSEEQLKLRFAGEESKDLRFWQRRFYDFNVWSAAKKKEKLHYMHANPVKEGLVAHPKD